MYIVFSVLIAIVSVILILIVLVQNSKGGGLASNFASSNQVMGVRKTADFLERATWTLAVALLVFSLGASMSIDRTTVDNAKSAMEKVIDSETPAVTTEENNDFNNDENATEETAEPAKEKPAEPVQ
ncbi:MAG: preprotein translocase subunit SecG [Bacteroidales bacterium]|jgi:preprotein translocase subunit SecG|nr:preprotein translocase subunit SecG [Bacteroidales bacterium]